MITLEKGDNCCIVVWWCTAGN